MRRKSHEIPHELRQVLRHAARQSAGDACPDETADRIADVVIAALLAAAHVEEQVRDRPLVDPIPPHATMDLFQTERRLAICTPPEPCSGYSLSNEVDKYGHLWFPVVHSYPSAERKDP